MKTSFCSLLVAVMSVLIVTSCSTSRSGNADYRIEDGKITEEVLNNYLDRAVTESEFLNSKDYNCDGYYGTDDDMRMLLNVGAKFIGRAMYVWGHEDLFMQEQWFSNARAKVDRMHAADPDIIFQAALFEIVTTKVNDIPIPDWVFKAFGLSPETRNFSFDNIRFPDGKYLNLWGEDTAVPDMSRLETQMWFYFMAVKYMDCGIEAFHCGQINLIGSVDSKNGFAGYKKLFSMIREYAGTHTRRGIVLLDAHCRGHVVDGNHLLDFASYPLRLKEDRSSTKMESYFLPGHRDSIVGKTLAGTTPSGWYTDRLPYLLEFDNGGVSDHPGLPGPTWNWGYDDISWIGNIDHDVAVSFLHYAYDWLKENDAMGHLQMPGMRIAEGADTKKNPTAHNPFRCNTASAACPAGQNFEETIKDIWNH